MRHNSPTEISLTNLIDNAHEDMTDSFRLQLSRDLGSTLWKIVDHLNETTDPEDLEGGAISDTGTYFDCPSTLQLTPAIDAELQVTVAENYDELKHTKEWLPNFNQGLLHVSRLTKKKDAMAQVRKTSTILIRTLGFAAGAPHINREQPYLATTVHGQVLSVPDTETTLAILNKMAEEIQQS